MKEDKKYQSMNKEEITRCDIIKDIQMLDVSSKFKAGIDEIQKLIGENKQVLVWGIFIDTLLKIKLELDKSNIIYGDISNTDRQKTREDFKQKNIQVLIANPNTLAESVSLHMICHDAIYFEYSFNLTHMLQSKDRINRLGLDEKQYTQYYYLMLENDNDRYNAIDEKIYLRLKEKEKIMKEAIEGEDLPRMNFDDTEDLELIMDKH